MGKGLPPLLPQPLHGVYCISLAMGPRHSSTSPFRGAGRRGPGAGADDAGMPSGSAVWLNMVAAGVSWLFWSAELLINELK